MGIMGGGKGDKRPKQRGVSIRMLRKYHVSRVSYRNERANE